MKDKRFLIAIPLLIVAAVLVYVLVKSLSTSSRGVVRVSGNIEAIDVDLSFRIPGWVAERPVDEGDVVRAGATVALLDPTYLRQQVDFQKAQVATAQAAYAELEAGSRPEEILAAQAAAQLAEAKLTELKNGSRPQEIAAAEAAVASAKAQAEKAKLDFDRQKKLYESATISIQDFQLAEATNRSAAAALDQALQQYELMKIGPRIEEIEQAAAAYDQARQNYALVKAGPRIEEKEQGRARLDAARQSLALAETQLGYATITSPSNAVVLSKNVEPGEYVSAGTPVVTIADLEHVYLKAYIEETDLGRVKLGQKARVVNDTFPDKAYEGTVTFISSEAEFTPKNVQTRAERVKLVYRIKIDIANPQMELKPGMPADAEILTSPSS